MKKFTSIAAALCLATAFSGMCAGCANVIKNEKYDDPATAAVTAADTDYKLILCPGYTKGYGSAANTISSGATKLTESEEATYFVHNAYFATVAAGEKLPTPTSTRTDVTFNGWRRAEDGELIKYVNMPSLTQTTFLYAEWVSKNGASQGGSQGGEQGDVTTGATVNGTALSKNSSPMAGVDEEYMAQKIQLAAGALTFKVNGNNVTINALDGASTGLSFSGGVVTVTTEGKFDIYLKKKGTTWEVYGARDASGDVTSIKGEAAVTGNIYLAGNVTDADFSWNNWNASGHKGLKVTGNTLTVKLTKGDNCKFVKYDASDGDKGWQNSLSGGGTHITMANASANMIVNDTGTYTFTITESGNNLSVTVTGFTAG